MLSKIILSTFVLVLMIGQRVIGMDKDEKREMVKDCMKHCMKKAPKDEEGKEEHKKVCRPKCKKELRGAMKVADEYEEAMYKLRNPKKKQ